MELEFALGNDTNSPRIRLASVTIDRKSHAYFSDFRAVDCRAMFKLADSITDES